MDLSAAVLAARRPGRPLLLLRAARPGRLRAGRAGHGGARGGARVDAVLGSGGAVQGGRARAASATSRGPVWVGGFAFSPDGGMTPEWSSLAPGQLVLPEVLLRRHRGEASMVITTRSVEDAERRAGGARPCLDAAVRSRPGQTPRGWRRRHRPSTSSRRSSGRWSGSPLVSSAKSCSRARCASTRRRRSTRRSCSTGCGRAFPRATATSSGRRSSRSWAPRRSCSCGARASACRRWPWPGTRRRSADPAVDSHLGEQLLQSPKDREEQAIVTRRIKRTLEPVSVWVTAADEPVLVKVLNVQHLGTPIRAQLAEPLPAVEVAGRLHPTPAVGGEPAEKALPLIPALEGLGSRLVRGPGRLDRSVRGRRVLRRPALRAAARPRGPPVRGRGHRARFRARRRSWRRTRRSSRRCCRC